ncbi:dihydrofolate reductase [Beijerinckia sp. L45]|uniref:dihydrofolate reductase n=1 Tax=Beijerinckia sp. L45 TaxID=1641855 RepID=UPI00131C26AE|nr:dihydrofolate reductase [Beijerinckia sp. L45]
MAADQKLPLTAVAALGRNSAIGQGNRLPWSMPGDLAHFRACTMGKPMIMGRLTFEAIGRALPGRESIVVTRSGSFVERPAVWRAATAEDALALAQQRAAAMGADEVILAGGATLFDSMMPIIDRLRLTFVDLAPVADTFFPAIDPAIWREDSRVVAPRHPKDEAACVFVDYVRRAF